MYTEISRIKVHSRVAWRKESMSKRSLARSKKRSRLSDARLQAVSSRKVYSEQGLLALMRPSVGQVCHSFIVVSNCTPGSAQAQAEEVICSHNSRAVRVLHGLGSRPAFLAFSFSVRPARF